MKNKRLIFLFLLSIPLLISLACQFTPTPTPTNPPGIPPSQVGKPAVVASLPVKPSVAASPTSKQNSPAGFTESDCYASGITFDSITTGNSVDEIYDGPYINCNYSTTGAHGLSETAYISIIAYKADMLDGFYMDLKDNLSGYVDQSNEWNAQPDLPAEAMDVIDMLRDDSDGYVFMITKDANVQGCKLGKGYGTEMVNGKYLVQIMFSSCEGDTSSYLAALDSLKSAAEVAIYRIETGTQP